MASTDPTVPERLGMQIFITLRRGAEYPPQHTDIRVKANKTVGELRAKAAAALKMFPEDLQLFFRGKELTRGPHPLSGIDYDALPLSEIKIQTGWQLQAYDLRSRPHYWPPYDQARGELVTERLPTKKCKSDSAASKLGQSVVARKATSKVHELYVAAGNGTAQNHYPGGQQPSWKPVEHSTAGYIDDETAIKFLAQS